MNAAMMPAPPPLRILQLVPEPLPTFRADVVTLFGKYLPRDNVHCDLVGMCGEGELGAQGFASVARPAPAASRWRREWDFFRLCAGRLLRVRKAQCDVIQVRDMVPLGLLALVLARLKGIPFVYWVSFLMSEGRIERARVEIAGGGGLRPRLVLLKGLVERALLHRFILRGARHVFVQSEAMHALLAAQGVPGAKMTPVPMGVDTELLAAQAVPGQRLPGWQGVPTIAYLGTLDRLRGLDILLDALLIVRRSQPQARLLLIGASATPSDVDRLLAHARLLGLADAVHVTGWLPSAAAWQLLAGADVAVSYLPRGNLFDTNSPTKLLEYLALGMPCVGNDNPDQAHVLAGCGAGRLARSTAPALAEALQAILAAPGPARAAAAAGPAYIDATRSYRVLGRQVADQYRRIVPLAVAA